MKTLTLYQIPVPDNGVEPEPIFLRHAGGYTSFPAQGGWTDQGSKHVIEDVVVYQVACTLAALKEIISDLRAAFPGEQEFMVATLGNAMFIPGKAGAPDVHQAPSNAAG